MHPTYIKLKIQFYQMQEAFHAEKFEQVFTTNTEAAFFLAKALCFSFEISISIKGTFNFFVNFFNTIDVGRYFFNSLRSASYNTRLFSRYMFFVII